VEAEPIHSYWRDEIFEKNYFPDITIFEKYIKLLPNIKSYKIVHSFPKMPKQLGESSLLSLGFAQAATYIPDAICIKTNGVVIMKYDIFEDVERAFEDESKDIYFNVRTNIGDQVSTRIFGFRANSLSAAVVTSSWDGWYEHPAIKLESIGVRTNWMEFKMEDVVKKHLGEDRIYYSGEDETRYLLDEGSRHNYNNLEEYRYIITKHIDECNIPKDNPLIKEFLEGGIW
jgi:hypothetical protein